jgi:hypothetical protein
VNFALDSNAQATAVKNRALQDNLQNSIIIFNMRRSNEIKKTVTIVNMKNQPSDFAYWNSQPYPARLDALEQIRQEYHRWRYGAEPRLQRVYSVVKR